MKKFIFYSFILLLIGCQQDQIQIPKNDLNIEKSINQISDRSNEEKNYQAGEFVESKIEQAIEQKSILGTGLKTLILSSVTDNQLINWEVETPDKSYFAQIEFEDSTKLQLESLLDHPLTAEGPDPGPPTECCVINIHGFSQPDETLPLFIFITGQGLQNVYGEGNKFEVAISTGGCPFPPFSNAQLVTFTEPPQTTTFECEGFDNWFFFGRMDPEWYEFVICGKLMVEGTRGYIPQGGNPFGSITPICSESRTLKWGPPPF